MPILADVYSYLDTQKRKLADLLRNPGAAVDQAVGNMSDQQNQESADFTTAKLLGQGSVLTSPTEQAAARERLADAGVGQALGGSLLVANPAKLYDKLLAASVKSRVALAEQQLVKGAKDADLWADPKIKLSLTPGLVKPTLQNKFLMELPHPVDDLSQVLRRGNEYSVGDIYDNSPILKAIPGLQYHSAITGGHAPVSPKTTFGAFYPGKLLSEIYEPGLVSAEKSATTGAH